MSEAMTFQPDCMTPRELDLWWDANRQLGRGASAPCWDCPAAWREDMDAAGRCNTPAYRHGRPRSAKHSEERRAMWREKSRAYRERKRAQAA